MMFTFFCEKYKYRTTFVVDFSDKSLEARSHPARMDDLNKQILEATEIAGRQPPRRFRQPKAEVGVRFIERSLSTTRVRQRLCDLMGTDVIRLNDRRYFEKLSQRLQDEYDTTMDKHEDARAQSEQLRQRRLMLEGVIEAPDDYRSLIHGEHKVKAKKKRRQRARSAMTAQCRTGMDETTLAPRIVDDEHEARSHKEAPEVITQVEMLALPTNRQPSKSKQSTPIPRNITSAKLRFRPMPAEAEKQTTTSQYDTKTQSVNEMHVRAPPHHNGAVRSPPSGSTYQSMRIKSASARLSHWDKASESESDEEQTEKGKGLHGEKSQKPFQKDESPLIKSLRQEQTVDGLYNIAAKLISPIKTEEMSRKGKKAY